MFVGTVSCEIEVGKAQSAFRGFRLLLVEPEHKVDWEGPVVAVDTVEARVGDLVVVALAPFGPSLEIPEDLPVEAAIVAVVRSLSGSLPRAPVPAVGVADVRRHLPPPPPAPPAPPAPRAAPIPMDDAEPEDVVPRHIRHLMEGIAPAAEARPLGDGPPDRGDGRRRRRRGGRGGRGGRGRPGQFPESEGEFLEDESRFPPGPTPLEMGPRDEDEPRPEFAMPDRRPEPRDHDPRPPRDLTPRDPQPRDRDHREPRPPRDLTPRDPEPRDRDHRERPPRDLTPRDPAPRDRDFDEPRPPRDLTPRDPEPRDRDHRDHHEDRPRREEHPRHEERQRHEPERPRHEPVERIPEPMRPPEPVRPEPARFEPPPRVVPAAPPGPARSGAGLVWDSSAVRREGFETAEVPSPAAGSGIKRPRRKRK